MVREFVDRDVRPVAAQHDADDSYPSALVDQMAEMGLFGITIPEEYGGLGLDHSTYAMIFEELSRGWLSITGPIGTHSILAHALTNHGTEDQKQRWLPGLAYLPGPEAADQGIVGPQPIGLYQEQLLGLYGEYGLCRGLAPVAPWDPLPLSLKPS